ncbi:hypothetical protein GGI12_002769 [Dipsacomyces acuminosporus]|nr:hypothetical protein GGI12_002769 [Dipsacomyces acuminosporus]
MELEKKLAKWVEKPQDDDDDEDDYGLIIDDSVTKDLASTHTFHSVFPERAPSAKMNLPPNLIQPLLPSNLPLLTKPQYTNAATTAAREEDRAQYSLGIASPAVKKSVPAQDMLKRYAEPVDSENYDDLVLPEEMDDLDKQLAQWKAPCRRMPSWPNDLNSEANSIAPPRSESTIVASGISSSMSTSSILPAAGNRRGNMMAVDSTASTISGNGGGDISARGPRRLAPTATNSSQVGSSAVAEGKRPMLIANPRQQKAPSSKQRVVEWQQQQQPQETQQKRPTRRPMLIRNISRTVEPVVIGCMRYDPISRLWVGNEEEGSRIASAIAESERQLRAGGLFRNERPLDAGKLARKISQRAGHPNLIPATPEEILAADHEPMAPAATHGQRSIYGEKTMDQSPIDIKSPTGIAPLQVPVPGKHHDGDGCKRQKAKPIFDPHNLRWIDPNESQSDPKLDPFWNITDLPVEPAGGDTNRALNKRNSAYEPGNANCGSSDASVFTLSDGQIEKYKKESIEYESFARHWFPKSSA